MKYNLVIVTFLLLLFCINGTIIFTFPSIYKDNIDLNNSYTSLYSFEICRIVYRQLTDNRILDNKRFILKLTQKYLFFSEIDTLGKSFRYYTCKETICYNITVSENNINIIDDLNDSILSICYLQMNKFSVGSHGSVITRRRKQTMNIDKAFIASNSNSIFFIFHQNITNIERNSIGIYATYYGQIGYIRDILSHIKIHSLDIVSFTGISFYEEMLRFYKVYFL